jgi:hypothetical protein
MSAVEQHYTVPQLRELWGCSTKTIIKLFENEPDVIRLGSPETRFKRKRIVLKIPESVVRRVHARLTESRRNRFKGSGLAIALYSFCTVVFHAKTSYF